jgi:hypothetical protein
MSAKNLLSWLTASRRRVVLVALGVLLVLDAASAMPGPSNPGRWRPTRPWLGRPASICRQTQHWENGCTPNGAPCVMGRRDAATVQRRPP